MVQILIWTNSVLEFLEKERNVLLIDIYPESLPGVASLRENENMLKRGKGLPGDEGEIAVRIKCLLLVF